MANSPVHRTEQNDENRGSPAGVDSIDDPLYVCAYQDVEPKSTMTFGFNDKARDSKFIEFDDAFESRTPRKATP